MSNGVLGSVASFLVGCFLMSSELTINLSAHDLKQPLNVMRLVADNLRMRIAPQLSGSDADYLATKLSRIEDQIEKILAMIERAASEHAAEGKA